MKFIKAIGRHISFDRSSTAIWVYIYILVEKVTVGCFPIEAFAPSSKYMN